MTETPETLAQRLRAMHQAKKYHPSGPGGQMCGSEQYRLVATGWEFETLQDAAADLEAQAAQIAELTAARDSFHMAYRMKCDAETKAQAEQIEALRADAERWQKWLPWMRSINRKPYGLAREIDAIDAAMAEKGPK